MEKWIPDRKQCQSIGVCVVTGAVVCFCFGSQVGPMRGCEHNGPSLLLRGCSHWEASLWTASQSFTVMPVWLYLLMKGCWAEISLA